MANRPLPLPPSISMSPQRSRQYLDSPLRQLHSQQLQQLPHALLHQRSLDDYHLPRSSSSQVPLSSSTRNEVVSVKIRDSPTRKQKRPMSEIVTSLSGSTGITAGIGNSFYEQQRQSLLSNFAASFQQSHHAEGDTDDVFVYDAEKHDRDHMVEKPPCDPQQNRGRNFNRRADGKLREVRKGGADGGVVQSPRKSKGMFLSDSSHPQSNENHFVDSSVNLGQAQMAGSGSRPTSSSSQDWSETGMPRYQNDSPCHSDRPEQASKHPAG